MEPDGNIKGSPQLKCFSQNHGNNVILLENNTVAYRKASFANAVTVSEQPVLPGEIFLVEIEQTEPGWTGHMRLGLTQLSPTARLPFYSLPDLSNRGDSWICAITKHHNRLRHSENGGSGRRRSRRRPGRVTGSQQPQNNTQFQDTSNSRYSSTPTSGWDGNRTNGHCLASESPDKTTNGAFGLSASEHATRISDSIKESVSQLLEELALEDDDSSRVNGKAALERHEEESKVFICSACLSRKANNEVSQRSQNGCSSEAESNSPNQCSLCQPSSCNQVEQMESGVMLNINGLQKAPCLDSSPSFINRACTDETSEDGGNVELHDIDRRNHNEPNTDGVLRNGRDNLRSPIINEAVSEVVNMVQEEGEASNGEDGVEEHYVSCLTRLAVGDHIRTSRGLVPRSALLSSSPKFLDSSLLPLPTDAGSRIGLLYLPQDDNYAEMHYIINGEDQGVFTRLLPYNDAPLYAVVDVYGTTKRVRIIQLYETMSLQAACRAVILQRLVPEHIPLLPLPPQLLQYLLASDG